MRLKYEDTHSDQKFSESELYPLIAWKRPRFALATPTKRLLVAWKRPLVAWKRLRNAHALRRYSSLSENFWSEWVSSYFRRTVFSNDISVVATLNIPTNLRDFLHYLGISMYQNYPKMTKNGDHVMSSSSVKLKTYLHRDFIDF